ncbi:MAG: Stp1/IreP family PP2C-type Ser/Thr phosphatase [Coriobacteriia bacterium]|nr:Stp1/IreP family PP2C-type Ser/Thr phosphatase [Coriobacteriia bacterium]
MRNSKAEQSINFGCRTDVGRVRDHNEDSLLVESPLFAVADGMGGHAAGEVASEIAVDSLTKHAPRNFDVDGLARAVEIANEDIIKAVLEGEGKQGMGTTMTAAIIDGNKVCIAQVGDSRAYLLHNSKLQQITRDHSLMADLIETGQITPAEARVHPNRSLITRALGSDPDTFADKYEIEVESGDRLLLCSDGLSGMLEDDILQGFLNETKDPQECADKLIEQANAHGGQDNITAIVVDIDAYASAKKKKVAKKSKRLFVIIILLFLLIIGCAIGFGVFVVENSAYLVEEDGYVQVYKGVPGNFMGIELSHKEYGTDIYVKELRESTQEHFKDGVIKVSGIEAADRIIENYKQEVSELKAKKK